MPILQYLFQEMAVLILTHKHRSSGSVAHFLLWKIKKTIAFRMELFTRGDNKVYTLKRGRKQINSFNIEQIKVVNPNPSHLFSNIEISKVCSLDFLVSV